MRSKRADVTRGSLLWRAYGESILRQVVNEGLPLDKGLLCPRGSISKADMLGPVCPVDFEPLDSCLAAVAKYPLAIGQLSMPDVASTMEVRGRRVRGGGLVGYL